MRNIAPDSAPRQVAAQIPQQDIDAERGVLGGALLDSEALAILRAELPPEAFCWDKHRIIAQRLFTLTADGSPADRVRLQISLADAGELELVGGPPTLMLLEADATVPAMMRYHIDGVRERWRKRQLEQIGRTITSQSQNGANSATILADASVMLTEVASSSAQPMWKAYDGADTWEFPPVEQAIEQLLPLLGVIWWGGAPKRYKSLLLLYLCLAIASQREDVANKFKILRRPKILYIAREDGGSRLQERREDITSAWPTQPARGAIQFLIRPHFDLLNPAHIAWVRDACRRDGIGLLVLDTWTALSPTADPMSAADQARLAAVVVQLAEDIQGAVVVVDHSRKNRPDGQPISSADIFGPQQKWAAAEHIVMLEVTGDQRRLEVFLEGKDGDTQRFFLAVSPRGSGAEKFSYAGTVQDIADAQRAVGTDNRDAVHRVLVDSPEAVSVQEVTAVLKAQGRKLADDTVQKHIKALIAAGKARPTGQGKATKYFGLAICAEVPSSENAAHA